MHARKIREQQVEYDSDLSMFGLKALWPDPSVQSGVGPHPGWHVGLTRLT